jgi:hypothetical protein
MIKLIIKDVKIGWFFLFGIFILISFIMHMLIWTMMDRFGGVIIPVLSFIVMALCVASSFLFFVIDDTYKTDATFAGFPVARSRIVGARYVTCFLMTVFAFSIALSSCFSIVCIFNGYDPAFHILLSLRGIAGMLAFLFFVLSCILPFVFAFGLGRGFAMALSTLVSIPVLWTLSTFIMKAIRGVIAIDLGVLLRLFNASLKWITALKTQEIYLFLASVVLMIVLLSLGLSICFYKRLDL